MQPADLLCTGRGRTGDAQDEVIADRTQLHRFAALRSRAARLPLQHSSRRFRIGTDMRQGQRARSMSRAAATLSVASAADRAATSAGSISDNMSHVRYMPQPLENSYLDGSSGGPEPSRAILGHPAQYIVVLFP
jgi:hypothetical protein